MSHLRVRTTEGSFSPHEITATQGRVIDPQHMLDNDAKPVWMGQPSTTMTFHDRNAWREVHRLECALKSSC